MSASEERQHTTSPNVLLEETPVLEGELHTEQLLAALSFVLAAQGEGEVKWIQFIFSGDGKVTAQAFNTQLSLRYEFLAQYQGKKSIKIPGKLLFDYIKALPSGLVTLHIDETFIKLQSGRSRARYQLIQDPSTFNLSVPQEGCSVRVKGEKLLHWLDAFKDFVAIDDTRFYANGACIWVEKNENAVSLHAVASDAQRLAKATLTEELELLQFCSDSVLVPRKALDELRHAAQHDPGNYFTLQWSQEGLYFIATTPVYTLKATCIAAKYPPWEAALPKQISYHVQCKNSLLQEAIRRVLLATDQSKIVRMTFDASGLTLEGAASGKDCVETLELLNSLDKSFEVKFHGVLLSGILGVLKGDTVNFFWETPLRPVKITGENERGIDVYYLLVPTRN